MHPKPRVVIPMLIVTPIKKNQKKVDPHSKNLSDFLFVPKFQFKCFTLEFFFFFSYMYWGVDLELMNTNFLTF